MKTKPSHPQRGGWSGGPVKPVSYRLAAVLLGLVLAVYSAGAWLLLARP